MKDHFPFVQFLNYGFCRNHILDDRLACHNLGDYGTVRLVNIESFVISKEIQCLDQFHVSACRRHPVILYDFASEGLDYFRKTLKADVDHLWLLGKKRDQLLRRFCLLNFCNRLWTDVLCRLFKIKADGADCRVDCQFIILADDDACFFQLANRLVIVLEISSRTAYGSDEE